MKRRSRLLRVAKWGGVVLFVLILAAGIVNGYLGVMYRSREFTVWILAGSVDIAWWAKQSQSRPTKTEIIRFDGFQKPIWGISFAEDEIAIPLWAPLLLVAIPTALLWYLDRRPLPGHCPCGYNLTGNESGTCPECGRETTVADP